MGLFARESRLPSVDDQAVVLKQFSCGLDDGGVDLYAGRKVVFKVKSAGMSMRITETVLEYQPGKLQLL